MNREISQMARRRRARNQRTQVKYLMLKSQELKKMLSLLLVILLLRKLPSLTSHSTKLSLLEMWRRFSQLLIINLPPRKTPSPGAMLAYFSQLLLKRMLFMMCTKTWNSWASSMLTPRASNCSPKTLVLASRKSVNSMLVFKRPEISTKLPSASSRFLLKTSALCSLKKLLRNMPSFISSSTRKRRSLLSLPIVFLKTKNSRCSKPLSLTHRTRARNSWLSSK